MERIANLRNWLLLAVALALLAAIPIANRLTFDQTIESFFPPDNPDIQILKRSRADFGGDEFVIVAWREPGLLQQSTEGSYVELGRIAAERMQQFSKRLSELPGVDVSRTKDLHRLLQRSPRNRNTRQKLLDLFDGVLIGTDRETTAIVLQLHPESVSGVSREHTIREIRRTAAEFDPTAAVAGEAVQIQDMFDLVERDGNLLYLASLLILSVILQITFRSFRLVLASIGIVLASVMLTRALLVLAGSQLSMVSSMLNSLVTIISISTTTHVIVHYRELRLHHDPRAATVRTLNELWHPVLWTMITIAVGFAALLVSRIVPIRSFAIMMTLATLLVPLITLCVLPATFASGSEIPVPGRLRIEARLDRLLSKTTHAVERHALATTLTCVLLTLVTAPGLFLMQIETDFSRNFRDSSPIVQSLKYVESRLGPAGSWDVAFDVPQPMTNSFLDATRRLTDKLHALTQEGLSLDILSLNDAIDVPPRLGAPVKRLDAVTRRQPDLVSSFYNEARGRMRIVLRSPEQQPTEQKLAQIDRVRQVLMEFQNSAKAVGDESVPDATASGLFVLMSRIIDSLLADQFRSFVWASIGTVLCMTIAFRSLRIGLISLVPNVFPIALVTGVLGLMQVPVNIGTAMIASVSMGFTCSVHYIAVFQSALPRVGVSGALREAQAGVGKAVVLAHIALVAGFMVLTASEFIPLVYFGALLSLSMVGGLVSDLILLPLLLRWTTKQVALPIHGQPAA